MAAMRIHYLDITANQCKTCCLCVQCRRLKGRFVQQWHWFTALLEFLSLEETRARRTEKLCNADARNFVPLAKYFCMMKSISNGQSSLVAVMGKIINSYRFTAGMPERTRPIPIATCNGQGFLTRGSWATC